MSRRKEEERRMGGGKRKRDEREGWTHRTVSPGYIVNNLTRARAADSKLRKLANACRPGAT